MRISRTTPSSPSRIISRQFSISTASWSWIRVALLKLDHHESCCSPLAAADLKLCGRQIAVELSMKNRHIGGLCSLDRPNSCQLARLAQPGRYQNNTIFSISRTYRPPRLLLIQLIPLHRNDSALPCSRSPDMPLHVGSHLESLAVSNPLRRKRIFSRRPPSVYSKQRHFSP